MQRIKETGLRSLCPALIELLSGRTASPPSDLAAIVDKTQAAAAALRSGAAGTTPPAFRAPALQHATAVRAQAKPTIDGPSLTAAQRATESVMGISAVPYKKPVNASMDSLAQETRGPERTRGGSRVSFRRDSSSNSSPVQVTPLTIASGWLPSQYFDSDSSSSDDDTLSPAEKAAKRRIRQGRVSARSAIALPGRVQRFARKVRTRVKAKKRRRGHGWREHNM